MKDFTRRDAIKLGAGALAAASLPSFARAQPKYGTNNIGRPVVPFSITNNTGQDLYMYAWGTTMPGTGKGIYFISDFSGDCEKFPDNAGNTPIGIKLPAKVTNAYIPQLDGVRVYFSVGKKLIVPGIVNGLPNPIEPHQTTDPNFDTLWDFFEGTWHDYGTFSVFNYNQTQVNAFAIAFELLLQGAKPGFPDQPDTVRLGIGNPLVGSGVRGKIFSEIKAAGAPWSNLIIPDPAGGPALRVLQPGYALTNVGLGDLFPKDQLYPYIHNTILPYYDQSSANRLIYTRRPMQWQGYTSGDNFIFEPNNSDTKITFTLPAPSTVEAYNNNVMSNPNDPAGIGLQLDGVLQVSILRSTLTYYPQFPVPQADRSLYYTKPPLFEYARIIHKYALNNHAFCFQLDEIENDAGGTNQVWNPTQFDVTIHALS